MTTIAFDVDGTLRRSDADDIGQHGPEFLGSSDIGNEKVVELLKILASFKSIKIIVWSGGGADYARSICRTLLIDKYVDSYASKLDAEHYDVDICFDDQSDVELATVNIQV